jgi:predicted  nucleic acid-binding Zn-ribbon protein
VTARRNQLVILVVFFCLIGIFSGVAIWLISQSQQKERDLLRSQSDLQQTAQQMQILKEQNVSAIATRSKLQKDVTTLKKQLDLANKQNVSLGQMLKEAQTKSSALATDNSGLKVKLATAEQQLTALRQSFKPAFKPATSNPAISPTNLAPANSSAPAKR